VGTNVYAGSKSSILRRFSNDAATPVLSGWQSCSRQEFLRRLGFTEGAIALWTLSPPQSFGLMVVLLWIYVPIDGAMEVTAHWRGREINLLKQVIHLEERVEREHYIVLRYMFEIFTG
jgi:hypothetical protein